MVKKEHPYILVDANQIHDIKSKLATSGYQAKYSELLRTCDNYIQSVPHYGLDPGWYIFTDKYQEAFRQRPLYLSLAYILSGEVKYAEEAKREIFNLLENVVGTEYILKQELSQDAGIIAATLGITYDWLYNYFTDEERDKIRKGIILRILEVYYDCLKNGKTQFQNTFSIRNTVINGGMGVAILALYNEWDAAKSTYELCYKNLMENFIERLPADGGVSYGINQWRNVISQVLLFANALLSATGSDNGIFELKCIKNCGYFPIYMAPLGQPLGFGDLNAVMAERYNYTNWIFYNLSTRLANPIFAHYRNKSLKKNPLELLWDFQVNKNYAPNIPKTRVYKNVGTAIISTGLFEEDQVILGFKNGSNIIYQSHKDLNSFIIKAFGQNIICDLGSDKSSYQQDGDENVKEYYKSTHAHNTILVNDKGQVESKGEIVRFEEMDGYVIITGDASQSYGPQIKKFRRNMIFVDNGYILLVDEIEANEDVEIKWLFHTFGEVKTREYDLDIRQKSTGMQMMFGKNIDIRIELKDSVLQATPEFEYQRKETIITCRTVKSAKDFVFAAFISPYKRGENEKIHRRIDIDGEVVTFEFDVGNGKEIVTYSINEAKVQRQNVDSTKVLEISKEDNSDKEFSMASNPKEEGKIEVAKAALKEGADVEFVVRITGLSDDVVKELKQEMLRSS